MIKRDNLRGLFVTVLLLCSIMAAGQEWNYARISLLYGGNVPFNFNSMQKMVNGIEVEDGTILGISLADSNQVGYDLEGFDIRFRAFNGAAVISGDAGDLPLDRIRVRATDSQGLASGVSSGYQDLSTGWIILFSYINLAFTDLTWDNHQISISYDCGIPVSAGGNGSLLGEYPDYYTVEIEIELMPTGPGF